LEGESDQIRTELLTAAIEYGEFPEVLLWQLGASPATTQAIERHGFKPLGRSFMKIPFSFARCGTEELNAAWMLGGRRLDDAKPVGPQDDLLDVG